MEKHLIERFWSKVSKSKTSCWEWMACINEAGYGIYGIGGKRIDRAHRISFRLKYGEIPEGKFVCHKCDNRRCVRPSHLFIGSNDDNVRDMLAKGRGSKPPPMGGWNKLTYPDEIIDRLGKEPDTVIARDVGVSKHAIARERRRRGILPHPPTTQFTKGMEFHPCWGTPMKGG